MAKKAKSTSGSASTSRAAAKTTKKSGKMAAKVSKGTPKAASKESKKAAKPGKVISKAPKAQKAAKSEKKAKTAKATPAVKTAKPSKPISAKGATAKKTAAPAVASSSAKAIEKPKMPKEAAKSQAAVKKAKTADKPLAKPRLLSLAPDDTSSGPDLGSSSEALDFDQAEETGISAERDSEGAVAAEGADKAVEKKTKRRDELKIDRNGNLEQQWRNLFERSKNLKPIPYKMSENYEARTALQHKVLGWGYVLTSQNNRLEVLFKDGIKILIANYKSA
jgi:hypothetical protein